MADHSIEIVSTQQEIINKNNFLIKGITPPPKIVDFHEINGNSLSNLSLDQKNFYFSFKYSFLFNCFMCIDEKEVYAKLLFYEIIKEYNTSDNSQKLKERLMNLRYFYPKTTQLVDNYFIKYNFNIDCINFNNIDSKYNQNLFGNFDLGERYKTKIVLSETELHILNSLIDTYNKFNSIEYCAISLIKIFLNIIVELNSQFIKEGNSLQNISNTIANIEINEIGIYKQGSHKYNEAVSNFNKNIYQVIYKCCENELRDALYVGRKTNLNFYIHSEKALAKVDELVIQKIKQFIIDEIKKLPGTDYDTEVKLNGYCQERWRKILYNEAVKTNINNLNNYHSLVCKLEKENYLNPKIEGIFFEASNFVATFDRVSSLKYYIDYICFDFKSDKFDNRRFSKSIEKKIFKTSEELKKFSIIINNLIKDKDRELAKKEIENTFGKMRKEVILNKDLIDEIKIRDFSTTELLNEYLKDDQEKGNIQICNSSLNTNEKNITIISSEKSDHYLVEGNLLKPNSIQKELIGKFVDNSFVMSKESILEFAKIKKMMLNQLIESINELFFEKIDDMLIDSDENKYYLNEQYYRALQNEFVSN